MTDSHFAANAAFAPAAPSLDSPITIADDGAASLPALAPDATPPAIAEDPPFDREKYDWHPVLRKKRADGWTPGLQRKFIEALADTGSVAHAARAVGMSERSCYNLRRAPGSEGFCAAWSAAIDEASKRLIDAAFERALVGTDEPVFDRDGRRVGRRFRQSDKLLMFLLRAYRPDRFRHAIHDTRHPAEPAAALSPPVHRAIAALAPLCPADPHLLISEDELETRLQCADLLDGKLPHWVRDPDIAALEAARTDPFPMGEELERQLEDCKRANAGWSPYSDDEWAAHVTRVRRAARGAHEEWDPHRDAAMG